MSTGDQPRSFELPFTPMGHGQVRTAAEQRAADEAARAQARETEWETLERLAKAATPGPWVATERYGAVASIDPDALAAWVNKHPDGHRDVVAYGGALVGESMQDSDRAFVAAANPSQVLALLTLLALYTAQRDDYKRDFEFQCRQRGIGERMEREQRALMDEMQASHTAFVEAVHRLDIDTQPVSAARINGLERIVTAARALLTDDDMPRHFEDCACSYCVRRRELVFALADLAGA